ncbi:hypothetical protein RYA05_03445 [Pseudomonas syringae pv. actinidiae]|nr:hypothetical protein [Pseudomonas syringae pv. actinidiae]
MSPSMVHEEKSRYEIFSQKAKEDINAYRDKLQSDGTFSFVSQVLELERLGNHMNTRMLEYLFGDLLGSHLADKFANQCRGNLLAFLSRLTSEYRFFILHELKNNKLLFSYC